MDKPITLAPLRNYLTGDRGRAAQLARDAAVGRGRVSEVSRGITCPGAQLAIRLAYHSGLTTDQILAPWILDYGRHVNQSTRSAPDPRVQTPADCGAAT